MPRIKVSTFIGPLATPKHSCMSAMFGCYEIYLPDTSPQSHYRAKALTTGTVPNFIDVVLNLASPKISEDSFLRQAVEYGNKIVFYGDDTWLKLFPDSFIRSEGTTSFFVSDFTEVNYQQGLNLNSPDWDVMILHYLGLDHIGHLEGPESRHVGPKLHEMDNVVRRIHQQLDILDATSELPSAMVVCGDHGMKDSGSHGGASLEEVLVPIVTIGLNCPGQDPREEHSSHVTPLPLDKEFIGYTGDTNVTLTVHAHSLLSVSQVDLVPTLAVMLALPIPAANLGKLISPLLHALPPTRQLYSLYYNSKQVAKQFRRQTSAYRTREPYLDYEEATRLHSDWLMQADPELVPRIVTLYTSSLSGMSSQLVESMALFDLPALVIASFVLWQVFALLLVDANAPSSEHVLLGTLLSLGVHSLGCFLGGGNSFLCCLGLNSGFFLAVFTAVVIAVNCCVLTSCWPQYVELCRKFPRGDMKRFLLLGTVLHSVSLASSSFIEEEHQVWYFLFLTFSLVTLACLYKSLMPSEALYGGFLLVLHRILRKMNQTGDKWASLPDIGDWLVQPGQKTFLTAVFLLGQSNISVGGGSNHYIRRRRVSPIYHWEEEGLFNISGGVGSVQYIRRRVSSIYQEEEGQSNISVGGGGGSVQYISGRRRRVSSIYQEEGQFNISGGGGSVQYIRRRRVKPLYQEEEGQSNISVGGGGSVQCISGRRVKPLYQEEGQSNISGGGGGSNHYIRRRRVSPIYHWEEEGLFNISVGGGSVQYISVGGGGSVQYISGRRRVSSIYQWEEEGQSNISVGGGGSVQYIRRRWVKPLYQEEEGQSNIYQEEEGLLGVCVSCHYLNTRSSRRDLILYSIAAAYIYCCRAATGSVLLPFAYPLSR
uniref:GPI ethanolamine phosphate transferase 2 C-terminal domain-containing protein n=1 Tax=Timema monikensis TaxID=170555 RepID=A0A7R9EBT8_9NEOP|nr:unnamed protein product [Timema monikensis]